MIKSARELQKINIKEVEKRHKNLAHTIKKLKKSLQSKQKKKESNNEQEITKLRFALHQKQRKYSRLKEKVKKLKQRGICLGSRKLFKKQFQLEKNNYNSHEEWLEDFRSKRNNRIFFIGSKDETFGNQNCQLLGNSLQVRVTRALESKFGKYVKIPVTFSYKEDIIKQAIKDEKAIHYRFVRKEKGWYLFVTIDVKPAEIVTSKKYGAIGIDLNSSHVAFAETNRHGNLVNYGKINTPIQDRSSQQVTATLAEASLSIIKRAKQQEKPIVIEKLDFSNKKCSLEGKTKKYKRMLSYFAYHQFAALVKSQAGRLGVEIIEVNPAYSSIIGKYKFSYHYGINTHIAASFVLARRALKFSESIPTKAARWLPEDNQRHVWSHWKAFDKIAVSNRGLQVELISSRHVPF